MEATYLLQRLERPTNFDNPFSFGGGLKHGGLSDEAWNLLKGIMSFDYMGSAEFEMGALPKAFQKVAQNAAKYLTFEMEINKMPVYGLGMENDLSEIQKTIISISKNKIFLKEGSRFDTALGLSNFTKKENCRTFGWFDLENAFLFFVDKEMFNGVCDLFAIKQHA